MRFLESITTTLTFWIIFNVLAGVWFYYANYVALELTHFVRWPITVTMFVIAVLLGVLSLRATLRDEL